ncbi:hypothetical protein ACFQ3Z_04990 [Streptomyces nogalater]
MRALISRIPVARLRAAGLLDSLLKLSEPAARPAPAEPARDIRTMAVADLVRAALDRTAPSDHPRCRTTRRVRLRATRTGAPAPRHQRRRASRERHRPWTHPSSRSSRRCASRC